MEDYLMEQDSYLALHYGENKERYFNAMSPPVFMTSLHVQNTIEEYYGTPVPEYIYGRYGNPTVEIAEKKLAALERGKRAFLYSSGMTAAVSAVMAVCQTGSHIICVHNAYGVLQEFLRNYCSTDLGIDVTFVHGDSIEEIEQAILDNTVMMILETPGSATFSLVDLEAAANLAKRHGIVTFVDNTYCSPIFQKPLNYGIDIVMHSATKYLSGHSDLLGGALVTSDDWLIERLNRHRIWFGGILGPMDAWLLIRGMRTLEVRMREHARTAQAVAEALEKDSRVKKVYYPGLKSHPQYELAKKQQTSSSGLLSFELDAPLEKAVQVVNRLKIFQRGPSWGGYESLAVMPLMGNSEEYAKWYGGNQGLIRIHCGLEGTEVLLRDLQQALEMI